MTTLLTLRSRSLYRALGVGAAATVTALVLTACGSSGDTDTDTAGETAAVVVDSDGDDTEITATTFNEVDVMFAQMMIPHHAQALEMAEIMLAKDGLDPQVVALVEQIRNAQGPEIELMTGWLAQWGAPELDPDSPGVVEMDGMVPPAGIDELRAAEGAAAEQLFLAQMIDHHIGAVEMAEDEIAGGADPAAIALAEEIIAAQQAEIDQMTAMLGD